MMLPAGILFPDVIEPHAVFRNPEPEVVIEPGNVFHGAGGQAIVGIIATSEVHEVIGYVLAAPISYEPLVHAFPFNINGRAEKDSTRFLLLDCLAIECIKATRSQSRIEVITSCDPAVDSVCRARL